MGIVRRVSRIRIGQPLFLVFAFARHQYRVALQMKCAGCRLRENIAIGIGDLCGELVRAAIDVFQNEFLYSAFCHNGAVEQHLNAVTGAGIQLRHDTDADADHTGIFAKAFVMLGAQDIDRFISSLNLGLLERILDPGTPGNWGWLSRCRRNRLVAAVLFELNCISIAIRRHIGEDDIAGIPVDIMQLILQYI